MATRVWEGQSAAVAQESRVQVTAYDAASQYQILVNNEIICTASGGGNAESIVAQLSNAWNAVTGNPYAATITTNDNVTYLEFTADVAGNPYTFTTNVTGGSGTFGSVSDTVSNKSPYDWDNAENWSGNTVPVSTDDVVFRDSSVPVFWGLDQSSVTLSSLVIEASYTGVIGLNQRVFVTGGTGTTSSVRPEYRDDYLDIGWDECRIGETNGPGDPAGSGRLKLDNPKAGSSTTTIYSNSAGGSDANLPNVRLLLAHASADVIIRECAGGVGIAIDDPAETSTVGTVSISDQTTATRCFIGAGTTLTTFTQQGGDNELRAAANVTTVNVLDGLLAIEGSDYTVTTLNAEGGTVFPNNTPTGGNAITTVNIDGGTVDARRSLEARTWGTVNLISEGSELAADDDVVTITTLNEPDGPYTLQVV